MQAIMVGEYRNKSRGREIRFYLQRKHNDGTGGGAIWEKPKLAPSAVLCERHPLKDAFQTAAVTRDEDQKKMAADQEWPLPHRGKVSLG